MCILVSNDEIRKKLKEKREGSGPDELYCSQCGTKNTKESAFCKECGANLVVPDKEIVPGVKKEIEEKTPKKSDFPEKHPKLAKIPGFRSGMGWKMIIGSAAYVLIALIIVFVILIALINVNVATNVNSALYSENLAGNSVNQASNNSSSFNSSDKQKFLIMNISVKNNGNGKVTIDPNDFSLSTGNQSANSKVSIGNTSISSIDLNPGENKTMLIAFIISQNNTPTTLKYANFWDMGSEGISANIGKIYNQTPINGQYAFYTDKGEFKWSGGSKKVEKTYNFSYEYLNEPFTISYSSSFTLSNGSSLSYSTTTEESVKQTTEIKLISPTESTIDISGSAYISMNSGTNSETLSAYLRDKNGVYQSLDILNPFLSFIGSSMPIVDSNKNTVGNEKLIRSEVIEIMGKKFDCWVTETKTNSTNEQTLSYYDKTTKLLLKKVQKYTLPGSSDVTYSGETVLTATNVPLVGLKS